MTQEEKARAYDEAMERAREFQKSKDGLCVLTAESIFPQLRENDGEWIRKYLIEELKAAKSVGKLKFTIPQPTREECIAYLEKQKENIEKEYVFRPLAGTDINSAVLQAIRRADEGDRLVLAFNGAYIPVRKGVDANKIVEIYDAFIEKQKDASKAIEAVDRIDKYIDEHLANAHDMKDSNPDKKYYRGWDDALGEMARILQDVYSGEKQKEPQPIEWEWPNLSNCIKNCKKCHGKCFYRKEPYEEQKQECGEKGLKGPQEIGDWRGDEGVCKKQKEQNGEDEECTDFTIYHPLKNGNGEYECIPYSFYGSLTSFSEDKDLIDFLRTCFYTEEECNEWIELQKEEEGYEAIPVESTLEYKLGFKAGKESEKQKEQKPAEKSPMLKKLKEHLANTPREQLDAEFEALKDLTIDKPSEWSEEEKGKVVEYLHATNGGMLWSTATEITEDILDILRPQKLDASKLENFDPVDVLNRIKTEWPMAWEKVVGKQEWSEEDEEMINTLVSYVEDPSCWNLKCPREKLVAFIESLPKRFSPQPKQEWSEEETKDLVHILKVLDDCYAYGKHDLSKTDHDNLTSMIKSLRPSWKPSEEQIKYLLMLADYFESEGGTSNAKTLREFSEDLRKLI